MRPRKCISDVRESRIERAFWTQFKDNQIPIRTPGIIKGHEMKLKREIIRNSQTFKEAIEHVNEISSSERKGKATK